MSDLELCIFMAFLVFIFWLALKPPR